MQLLGEEPKACLQLQPALVRVYLYGTLAFEAGPVLLNEFHMWEVCELQVSLNKSDIDPVLSKYGSMKMTPSYKIRCFESRR